MFNVLFLFVIFRIYKYMAAVNIVNVLTNLLLIEYEIVLMEKCFQNSSWINGDIRKSAHV